MQFFVVGGDGSVMVAGAPLFFDTFSFVESAFGIAIIGRPCDA
jgi:hypothetical protein